MLAGFDRMRLLAFIALLPALFSAVHAQPNFGALQFGMSSLQIEKILGHGSVAQRFSNPEIEHVKWYQSSRHRDLLPQVYFNREGQAVAFKFAFVKTENGGNNPKTGRPWEIPPDLLRWCLAVFGREAAWTRLNAQDEARVLRAASGRAFARVSASEIFVSDRESLVRLKLLYR